MFFLPQLLLSPFIAIKRPWKVKNKLKGIQKYIEYGTLCITKSPDF